MNIKKGLLLLLLSTTIAACDGEELDKGSTSDNPQKIQLIKKTQQVMRTNCDGDVVSNKIETVAAPRKAVTIIPPTYEKLAHSTLFNHTTGSHASAWGRDTFYINYSPTWFDLEVDSGLNKIKFTFNYCLRYEKLENEETSCVEYGESISGYIYLDIIYNEVHLEGTQHIKPTETSCQEEGQE